MFVWAIENIEAQLLFNDFFKSNNRRDSRMDTLIFSSTRPR